MFIANSTKVPALPSRYPASLKTGNTMFKLEKKGIVDVIGGDGPLDTDAVEELSLLLDQEILLHQKNKICVYKTLKILTKQKK